MARSRNLANYETIYWELLEGMRSGIGQIELKLTKKVAINTQQTFYAFIRANEHASATLSIGGDIKHAQDFTDNANTMRGYVVMLRHNTLESILTFVNRDLNPKTQEIRDQIREQLKAFNNMDLTHE